MTVRIHFEALTSGMRAKLDTRYRGHNDYVINVRKPNGNGSSKSLLEDAVGKFQQTLVGRYK
jgi:hypothetical protein